MIQENEIFEYSRYKEACECIKENQRIEYVDTVNGVRRYKIVEIPKPTEKELAQQEIAELKQKLADTDYISNKLSEAVSKYIATGDNTEVVELRTKYSKQLEDRQLWRDRINEIQLFLKNQNG